MKKAQRQDRAEEKRVELHMHTQMSQMDAMTSATDLIKRAMSWGMKSIAITDHGVVQSFPEAHKLLGRDNPNMKVIYGVEAYLAPDKKPSVTNAKGQSIDTTYCVLDLETTGFSAVTEKITEIGIMKLKDGKVHRYKKNLRAAPYLKLTRLNSNVWSCFFILKLRKKVG